MMKKVNSRMYCLKKLKKFLVSADLLMFYNAVISSTNSWVQPVGVGMFQNMIKGGWIKSYIEPVVLLVDRQFPIFVSWESVT